MPLKPGQVLNEWRIVRRLGEGAMGEVFAAQSVHSDRIVAALKVLDPGWARHPDARERFLREAEVLYNLSHPGIVRVRNLFLSTDAVSYLEMELVSGTSVERRLSNGAIAEDEARRMAAEIAQALAYMHRRNVFHRDIKPANILIQTNGTVKVVDFGLAKKLGEHPITTEGRAHFGTAAYCPPEWIGAAPVDPARWDAYAFGVLLHELLTGEEPFPMTTDGNAGQQILGVMSQKLASPSMELGEGFDPVLRALVAELTTTDASKALTDLVEVTRRLDA